MSNVYWAGPRRTGASDKCHWIVESLNTQPNKYSRAVKVIDADQERLRLQRELGIGTPEASRAFEEMYAVDYPQRANGGQLSAGDSEESTGGCSFGHFLALWQAAYRVADGREDGTSGRIVGSLGSGGHQGRASAWGEGKEVNGLAVVARRLVARCGHAVLILDLDGSCGGGTASLIAGVSGIRQVDIAVNEVDAYPDTENASLRIVTSASHYLEVVQESLRNLDVEKERGRNPICIYSAGVDAFEKSPRGLPGLTAEMLAERDRLVFTWCRKVGIRTAYTIGCGDVSGTVSRETLVALHRQTIETFEAVLRKEQRNHKRRHR